MNGFLIGSTGSDIVTSSATVANSFVSDYLTTPLTMIAGALVGGIVLAIILKKLFVHS